MHKKELFSHIVEIGEGVLLEQSASVTTPPQKRIFVATFMSWS